MAKESPGVLKDFFTNFKNDASITDPELKQLINALRFIQFDRTLAITDATGNITGDMITKINEINDTQLGNAFTASVTFDAATEEKSTLDEKAAAAKTAKENAEKATATDTDRDAATTADNTAKAAKAAYDLVFNRNGNYQFYYIKYTPAAGGAGGAGQKYEYVTLDVDITNGKYTLKVNVDKEDDDDLSTHYKSVHNLFVKEKLKQYLNDNVYKLFSTPVKDIDSLSNPKNNKAFQHLKFAEDDYLYDKSLIDIILDLEHYIIQDPSSPSGNATLSVTTAEETTDKYKLFESIYDFMKRTETVDINAENKLIMDIVSFKDSIDKSKKNIKEQRNKIYTYLSRDENYTKTLQTKRIMLYLSIAASIIISVFYGGILYTNSMTNADKSTIVVVIASIILFINMILYIMRFTYQERESFSASSSVIFNDGDTTSFKGFTRSSQTQATIVVKDVMKEFSKKYVDLLSKEIKNEYYDTLYESQMKDKKLLEKLEKEHDIKSHFHQLKNNLSHFKINETKEYSKLSQLFIVLISLIAILYLTVLQDTIDMEIFNIVAGLTFIIFVLYVLLTVKSIMLRDKYDWDRFNWTVKNVKANMNPEQCPLPGFPQ